MNKPFTFPEYKNIYSQVPRLTVEIVIKSREGVLLTLRSIKPFEGMWHLPGGTVYFKEPLQDAIKRVAREELGVKVKVEKFLGYIEYLHQEKGEGFDHPVGLAFLCEPLSGKVILQEQANEVKYFLDFSDDIVSEQKAFLKKLTESPL